MSNRKRDDGAFGGRLTLGVVLMFPASIATAVLWPELWTVPVAWIEPDLRWIGHIVLWWAGAGLLALLSFVVWPPGEGERQEVTKGATAYFLSLPLLPLGLLALLLFLVAYALLWFLLME